MVGETLSTATMCPANDQHSFLTRHTVTHPLFKTKHTQARDGKTGNDVDVADGDLLDVMSVLREDLHARALVAAIAHDELAGRSHHGDFARVPQLPFLATYKM